MSSTLRTISGYGDWASVGIGAAWALVVMKVFEWMTARSSGKPGSYRITFLGPAARS